MISDVLSDAIDEIRRYLDDVAFSNVYSGKLRDEIEHVVEQMEKLRVNLIDHQRPVPQPRNVAETHRT